MYKVFTSVNAKHSFHDTTIIANLLDCEVSFASVFILKALTFKNNFLHDAVCLPMILKSEQLIAMYNYMYVYPLRTTFERATCSGLQRATRAHSVAPAPVSLRNSILSDDEAPASQQALARPGHFLSRLRAKHLHWRSLC